MAAAAELPLRLASLQGALASLSPFKVRDLARVGAAGALPFAPHPFFARWAEQQVERALGALGDGAAARAASESRSGSAAGTRP
jgi:hypothetical protein